MDRITTMSEYCKGKKVLDLGCVGSVRHHIKEPDRWLFAKAQKIAYSIKGIDLNLEGVQELAKYGYGEVIFHADAESLKEDNQYEVILCGEVIEHVNNPGLLIEQCYRLLEDDGLLVLSTPNIYSFEFIYKPLIGKVPLTYKDHCVGFDEKMITLLLARHKFKVIDIKFTHEYIGSNPSKNEKKKGIMYKQFLLRAISFFNKRLSSGMVVIAKKTNEKFNQSYGLGD
mgnify:CR=1 FL=1